MCGKLKSQPNFAFCFSGKNDDKKERSLRKVMVVVVPKVSRETYSTVIQNNKRKSRTLGSVKNDNTG